MRYRPTTLKLEAFSSIEPKFTVLDLSGFDLYRNKTPAEIVKILETIPANIISINLSPNRLGNIIPADIKIDMLNHS